MRKKFLNVVSCCFCLVFAVFLLITALYVSSFNDDNHTEEKNGVAYVDLENLINTPEFREEMNLNHKEVFGNNYAEVLSKNALSTSIAQKIEENFITENSEKSYPDYYGGMYINSEGDLVIQVTKESSNLKKLKGDSKYNTYITSVDNKNVDYVEYSYNELEEVNNKIISYFTINGVNIKGFVGNYIDVYTNRVIVELKNNSIDEQNEFKEKVINSEMITFSKGEVATLTASYNAGAGYQITRTVIENGSQHTSISDCSIGYRAKLNGVSGFVTAGHCFGKEGDSASIGSATKRIFNQTMDAAFVTTSSGVSISNDLNKTTYYTTKLNTSRAGYITSGTSIGKVGEKSGYQSGTIQSMNYSVTLTDGSYHSNLIKSSNFNIGGDSGGPLFKLGNSVDRAGTVIGVTSMGCNIEAGCNVTYFYNADDIASALGITRY